MRMAEILKTNMAKKTRKTHLIRFEWSSEMIEDPTDASQNHKAIWFDFNANKFKPYEEIRKSLARKYKEESFFGTKSLSEKPHEGFSTWFFTDESKIEFYKK